MISQCNLLNKGTAFSGHLLKGCFFKIAPNSHNVCFSYQSRVPVYLSNWPAGTSLKNIIHFGQVCGEFTTLRF